MRRLREIDADIAAAEALIEETHQKIARLRKERRDAGRKARRRAQGAAGGGDGDGMKRIPIVAARSIVEQYGYDQVVIIARKVGDPGGEHVTTYGRNRAHCDVAARIGDFLKFKIMGWAKENAA